MFQKKSKEARTLDFFKTCLEKFAENSDFYFKTLFKAFSKDSVETCSPVARSIH